MVEPDEPVVVAMDWGGTWARAAVANQNGELLWETRQPNVRNGSREQLLNDAESVLQQAIAQCRDRVIAGIGIAAAGPIDVETGTFHAPPNLPMLDGVSLKSRWESKFGYPVFVGNDANLAALGEYYFGAGHDARRQGRQVRTLIYVTVSTGVGGGVIDHGRMLLGAEGMAAEVGHMVLDRSPNAPRCNCGNYGCLEALTSGISIARIARQRAASFDGTTDDGTTELSGIAPDDLDSRAVFAAAARGDVLACRVVEEATEWLALGLTNLLHLFNPDIIVLGGGVTDALRQNRLLEAIQGRMRDQAMSPRHHNFSLVATNLGYTGGMVGAASLAWQQLGLTPNSTG